FQARFGIGGEAGGVKTRKNLAIFLRGFKLVRMDRSEIQQNRRHAGTGVFGEVVAGHDGRSLHDVVLPENRLQGGSQSLGEGRVVIDGAYGLDYLNGGFLLSPGSSRLGGDDTFDGAQQVLADLISVGTYRELQFHIVGNDVVLGPPMDGANRDNGRVL